MPRTKKPSPPPDPLKPPPKAVCETIVRRFLKEDQTIYWARELPCWYRLWKRYPSLAFWQGYELPFGEQGLHALNHISWFEGPEGTEDLARSWLLFNWTPPEVPSLPPTDGDILVDSSPPSRLHYPLPPARPRTVAEWLRG